MAKMDEKRKITEKITSLNVDIESLIENVIFELTEIKDKHEANGYKNIFIINDSWGEYPQYYVCGTRLETDKERDKRVGAARKKRADKKVKKQAKDDAEFKEYERLQKKFGGKS